MSNKIDAKLNFVYGAMGSAKTARLLMQAHNLEERGRKVLCVKPTADARTEKIWSRIGLERDCLSMDAYRRLTNLRGYDAILVDECQFLTREEVQGFSDVVDFSGVSVYCYGLRTDFQGNLFEGAAALFALADVITEVETVCHCGRPAIMNTRVCDGRKVTDGEQVVCGVDNYISLCRKCYKQGLLK